MTLRPHALALAAALAASPAYAVSLGQVQMQSGLGQPLSATVPVYDADTEDLRTLDVRLASEDAFRRLGLERGQYQDIQIRLMFDDSGRPLLQLSSERPFNEPVFNVLLDANWRDGGRLVKEVTALVDPPFIARTAVQTIEAPTVDLTPVVAAPVPSPTPRTPAIPTGSRPEQREPAPEPPQKQAAAKPAPRPAQPAAPAPARVAAIPATADNQREVRSGETLYAIAAERRGQLADSRISLNQMMAAIQRANPEAFIRGDANRLKRGSVLRLPDERQTRALLPEDSANLLNSQWARKVQAQPAPVLDAANRLGRRAAPTPARAAPGPAISRNQGRLKIVPTVGNMDNAGSQSGASRSGQGNELRSENAAGAEEIAARQVEIANLRKQLDEAAKLQSESKRLIELQNSQIKQLTERMQQIEKGAPATPVAATAQPATEAAAAPWYTSPFASIAALLLIAGLAGALLIRRRR